MKDEPISSKSCRKCAECCKNVPFVELSYNEINSLAAYTGLRPLDFINSKGPGSDEFFLKFKKNGYCIFLNNSNGSYFCKVYEVRPEICKTYPLNAKQNEFCRLKKAKSRNSSD